MLWFSRIVKTYLVHLYSFNNNFSSSKLFYILENKNNCSLINTTCINYFQLRIICLNMYDLRKTTAEMLSYKVCTHFIALFRIRQANIEINVTEVLRYENTSIVSYCQIDVNVIVKYCMFMISLLCLLLKNAIEELKYIYKT